MPTNADNISAAIANHLQALADDSILPGGSYSIDGQSVDRNAWRANETRIVKELYELAQMADPFEQRSYAV